MSANYLESSPFPEKERVRGTVGTTHATDTEVYVNENTYNVLVEAINLNATTTRVVDVGHTASDETYEDATYDIASAVSVAVGTPVQAAITPFLMLPGDKLDIWAAGAGIRYNVLIGKPPINQNYYGRH